MKMKMQIDMIHELMQNILSQNAWQSCKYCGTPTEILWSKQRKTGLYFSSSSSSINNNDNNNNNNKLAKL